MKYAALDFEVGNANLISACSVGLSVFEDFHCIRRLGCLIHPPSAAGPFHWGNVRVHGIRRRDVADAPRFDALWGELRDSLEGSVVVCHNAAFDTAVLCACLDYFGLPYPDCRYLCTVKVAQAVWPEMENHRLNTLAQSLGIQLAHHEAGSDAHAAGLLLLEALRATGCADAEELSCRLGLQLGVLGGAPCKTAQELRRGAQRRRCRRSGKPAHTVSTESSGKGEHYDERVFERPAEH